MKNPLEEYFEANRRNVIHKWAHYFEIYHRHFERFVGKECVILEIGVAQGGSLQMWKSYFGANAKIYGVDVHPACKQFEGENIQIFIGSQSDTVFLQDLIYKIPTIDILIDDGGHRMDEQITTLEMLFDHMGENSIYLCEDTHTSYWEDYGGGYQNPNSFIEYAKTLVDHLNAWHIRNNALPHSRFTHNLHAIHFYDSIVVFEKMKRARPWHERRGLIAPIQVGQDRTLEIRLFKMKLTLLGVHLPDNLDPTFIIDDSNLLRHYTSTSFDGTIWPEKGETMIGYKRLSNIEYCLLDLIARGVAGDVIETGAWRGGACIFMREILDAYGVSDKKVWVADSFEGLPKPNDLAYPADSNDTHHTYSALCVSLEEVQNNFKKYGLLDDRVVFLKGWFKDTMPTAPITQLSLLRLDGDMYESTIDVLLHLYPKLSIGGYCIIDDWGAVPACRKAVEDYRKVLAITERIQFIDWTGIYWKKEVAVPTMSQSDYFEALKALENEDQ
jgi:O-methyltransferase